MHHITLFACGKPAGEVGTTWSDCGMVGRCHDIAQPIYGWGRTPNNDSVQTFKLPANVSMSLDPSRKDQSFLVLHTHYAEVTSIPDWSGVRLKLKDTRYA